jgi:hypothetical protein
MFAGGCGGKGTTIKQLGSPPLQITTATLPDWMATFPFSQNVQATGGVGPLTWSISSRAPPHGLSLGPSTSSTVTIEGTPDMPGTSAFTLEVSDTQNQHASQAYTVNVKSVAVVTVRPVSGNSASGTVELQGVTAGDFNPLAWQNGTLNWVPDVRLPVLAPLSGTWQNIYSPWALEQNNGWRCFMVAGMERTRQNDRVYSALTPDFLTFTNRTFVIDHGAFEHVNNTNVHQRPDGSMHMICTVLKDDNSLDKPAYFSSPDGNTWNGTPAPYEAQLTDVVSVSGDPETSCSGILVSGCSTTAWVFSAEITRRSSKPQAQRLHCSKAPVRC